MGKAKKGNLKQAVQEEGYFFLKILLVIFYCVNIGRFVLLIADYVGFIM